MKKNIIIITIVIAIVSTIIFIILVDVRNVLIVGKQFPAFLSLGARNVKARNAVIVYGSFGARNAVIVSGSFGVRNVLATLSRKSRNVPATLNSIGGANQVQRRLSGMLGSYIFGGGYSRPNGNLYCLS